MNELIVVVVGSIRVNVITTVAIAVVVYHHNLVRKSGIFAIYCARSIVFDFWI